MAASGRTGDGVQARALAVLQEVAQPLIDRGTATVRRLERADPEYEGGALLAPTREGAAEVEVDPGPGFVTLLVGPRGYSHEIVVDRRGEWERELMSCLLAIVQGGYSEEVVGGRANKLRLKFHLVGGRVMTVNHLVLDGPRDTPSGERRFEPYE